LSQAFEVLRLLVLLALAGQPAGVAGGLAVALAGGRPVALEPGASAEAGQSR
jgi:hypothetical protein